MALAATAASISRLLSLHQTAPAAPPTNPQNDPPSQTIIYLSLGALIGVAYSLGTEKFIRAMQHRHIFIRNAMLWLSAIFWLIAAAAVAIIASLIYNQSGGGLEGFDRVLGVLIPFVVRADLIVDWAKRVAWALLNMSNWTQSSVQLCRMLSRARPMTPAVQVDPDIVAVAMLSHSTTPHDFVASEDRVWADDADSLVRVADVIQHFEKLGRVAVYAVGGLVGAVPATVAWILYAVYYAVVSFMQAQRVLGIMYCLSVVLAPLGAVIVVLSSAVLLCGVVALSIVGTLIQFAVYWSTRTVYSMVRIALSQAWAGFPDITRPHESSDDGDTGSLVSCGSHGNVNSRRRAEEAGSAIAHMGIYLPTELEFALASWDGFDHRDTVKADWFSSRLFNMNYFKDSESVLARDMAARSKRTANCDAIGAVDKDLEKSQLEKSLNGYHCDSKDVEVAYDSGKAFEQLQTHDSSTPDSEPSAGDKNFADNGKDTVVVLLRRLGLDLSVKSARKRRLSTYYAFGMLVQLQLDSGGNAWRLNDVEDISDEEFRTRIESFDSIIADEAGTALTELSSRLKGSSRYRVIPSGTSHQQLVPVTTWLRLALLAFLETPDEREESMHLRKKDTRQAHESPYTELDLHQWNRIGILDEDGIAFDVPTRITG